MKLKRALSLTTRLTIGYTLCSVALIIISTLLLYWALKGALEYRDTKLFFSKFEVLERLIQLEDEGVLLRARIEKEWSQHKNEVFYVQLVDKAGETFAVTPGSDSIFKSLARRGTQTEIDEELRFTSSLVHLDGRAYRSFVSHLKDGDEQYVVQIALDRTEDLLLLSDFEGRLFLILAVCFLVSALVSFQMARKGLVPLGEMAKTASRINSSNLSHRIVIDQMPTELAHLATTFNAMLDRLQASFDRLQQFSADIAHELRTPINNISGELQVSLGKSRSTEYYKDSIGSALEECNRISQIIDSLLFLANAENPRHELVREPIDVRKELEAAMEFYEPAAMEKGVACSLNAKEGLNIQVERTLFQRAVGNILSNAIKHTHQDGRIEIKCQEESGKLFLDIEDTGIGISEEHLPHLCDRFFRVDASRSKASGGTGLGLAIAKSILSIHGGSIQISSKDGEGTKVRMILPASCGA